MAGLALPPIVKLCSYVVLWCSSFHTSVNVLCKMQSCQHAQKCVWKTYIEHNTSISIWTSYIVLAAVTDLAVSCGLAWLNTSLLTPTRESIA